MEHERIRCSTSGRQGRMKSVCPLSVCSANEYFGINETRWGEIRLRSRPWIAAQEETLFNFDEHVRCVRGLPCISCTSNTIPDEMQPQSQRNPFCKLYRRPCRCSPSITLSIYPPIIVQLAVIKDHLQFARLSERCTSSSWINRSDIRRNSRLRFSTNPK